MKLNHDHNTYTYIAVYVNDVAIAKMDLQPFIDIDILTNKYNFNLKGTAPLTIHLGFKFMRAPDGGLCMSAKRYINRIEETLHLHT